MKTLLICLLISIKAHAGCPAIGAQNVSGLIGKCDKVNSPEGSTIEFLVKKISGQRLGLDLASEKKYKIFVYPDKKFVCKGLAPNAPFCIHVQQWCAMVGPRPHGANYTAYDLRPGPCP